MYIPAMHKKQIVESVISQLLSLIEKLKANYDPDTVLWETDLDTPFPTKLKWNGEIFTSEQNGVFAWKIPLLKAIKPKILELFQPAFNMDIDDINKTSVLNLYENLKCIYEVLGEDKLGVPFKYRNNLNLNVFLKEYGDKGSYSSDNLKDHSQIDQFFKKYWRELNNLYMDDLLIKVSDDVVHNTYLKTDSLGHLLEIALERYLKGDLEAFFKLDNQWYKLNRAVAYNTQYLVQNCEFLVKGWHNEIINKYCDLLYSVVTDLEQSHLYNANLYYLKKENVSLKRILDLSSMGDINAAYIGSLSASVAIHDPDELLKGFSANIEIPLNGLANKIKDNDCIKVIVPEPYTAFTFDNDFYSFEGYLCTMCSLIEYIENILYSNGNVDKVIPTIDIKMFFKQAGEKLWSAACGMEREDLALINILVKTAICDLEISNNCLTVEQAKEYPDLYQFFLKHNLKQIKI